MVDFIIGKNHKIRIMAEEKKITLVSATWEYIMS